VPVRAATRAAYRGRQFFGSVLPRVDRALRDEAFALLNERERALFSSMTRRDQQHCLAVYRRLRDGGHDERDLLVAALLHDAGKGEVALWHRVAYVLLEASAPALLERAAARDARGYRGALYRLRHHPEIGAALAREAGSPERAVRLIRAGGDAPAELLAALEAADEAV
jgi:hypothetical protein